MLALVFLATFFIALITSYYVHGVKRVSKGIETESSKRRIVRLKHLAVPLPVIDGLYLLYQIQKDGVEAIARIFRGRDTKTLVSVDLGYLGVLASQDATYTNKILCSTDPGHLNRPKEIYERIFVDTLARGLVVADYDIWSHKRKMISKCFTYKAFPGHVRSMNRNAIKMVDELSRLCAENNGSTKTVSGEKMLDCINVKLLMVTLDFIMGPGHSESLESFQFYKRAWRLKELVMNRWLHPWLFFPPLWWLHPHRKEMERLTEENHKFGYSIIEAHRKSLEAMGADEETTDVSLIETMLREGASFDEIFCEIGTFLIAGHETVAVALNILLQHLGCQQEHQARCREEVDALIDSKLLASDKDGTLTDEDGLYLSVDDIAKLEYLDRFVSESMRIAPLGPFVMRVLNTPLKIDEDCTLEKGRILMISPWLVHHNPEYYPQPDKFDPDRFLPEEVKKRPSGAYVPFLAGPRNCIGKRYGMLAVKTMAAWILRRFEVFSEDGLHGVKYLFEGTLKPERDFRISLKLRKDIPKSSD